RRPRPAVRSRPGPGPRDWRERATPSARRPVRHWPACPGRSARSRRAPGYGRLIAVRSTALDPAGAGQRRRQLAPVLKVHFREDERKVGLLEVAGSLARGGQVGPVLAVEGVVAMETEADPLEEAPAGQAGR